MNWTHVKVATPERGESPKWSAEVLGVTNGGRIIVCSYCFMDKSWRDYDDLERDIVYWMPLPALPELSR